MRIVISMGDPCGIGPEVIVKALAIGEYPGCSFLVIGEQYYLDNAAACCGVALEYERVAQPRFAGRVALYQPEGWIGEYSCPGNWSLSTGRASLEYVRLGAELCLQQEAQALVTAPICKSAWKAAGSCFPGHTELLGEISGEHNEVMLLAGGGLRVALVTTHVALRELPELLTQERICRVLSILNKDLQQRFALPAPRIAVLGLNPHAGEDGHLGCEELEVINPAVKQMQGQGIAASGALPADTAFYRMLSGEFDAILAMYHDQGLGPLKTLAFDSGVNITLGLPLIRTSVDHGTAFDLAGRGVASCKSMMAAIAAAAEMVKNSTGGQDVGVTGFAGR